MSAVYKHLHGIQNTPAIGCTDIFIYKMRLPAVFKHLYIQDAYAIGVFLQNPLDVSGSLSNGPFFRPLDNDLRKNDSF